MRQIGNAVPVELARVIATAVMEKLRATALPIPAVAKKMGVEQRVLHATG